MNCSAKISYEIGIIMVATKQSTLLKKLKTIPSFALMLKLNVLLALRNDHHCNKQGSR